MFHKSLECLWIASLFLAVRSQKPWRIFNGGYNAGIPNSWNPNNGFSSNNINQPSTINAGSWGSPSFSLAERPNEKLSSSSSDKNSFRGFETSFNNGKDSGWNQNKPSKISSGNSASWTSDSFRRPNEKKLSTTSPPSSSKWSTNSNNILSNEGNLAFSNWGSNNVIPPSQSNSPQSNPEFGFSNNYSNNQPNDNEIPTDFDYDSNSMYSSWSSSNKKKPKPTPNPFGGPGNRGATTQKSKWEINDNTKQEKPSGFDDSSKPGKEQYLENGNAQTEKSASALDTSILDELDKNDWYFGKESNYPKPPLRSPLNIDVSELWNFDKNKNLNTNSQRNNNNNNNSRGNVNNSQNNKKNNNRRRNREIKEMSAIQCKCVNVNLCEEEDMVITKEDIKFDLRPLEEFRCEKLTEVCCRNFRIPETELSNRANLNNEKEPLRCGERRRGENLFEGFSSNLAEPGEFPWNLKLENTELKCSASLIHHKLALTAAHCVAGARLDELEVKAGIWNSNDEEPQTRRVAKIIPHPDYNSRNPRNDIALLVLETPFELTDNVNTICLPMTNDKWDPNHCVVAGWKPEEIHEQVSEVLEKGIVKFLPQPECQNIMLITDLWRNYVLHDSFVCGLEKTGKPTCTGDEGGFVICPSIKRPNTYEQIGIVSKGMNCDEFGRPGIFTNVLKFLDWINKNYFELGLFDDIDIRQLTLSELQ